MRELGWELIASFKNTVGVVTKRYSDVLKFFDRGNTHAIADNVTQTKRLVLVPRGFRKIFQIILSDLSIIDAVEKHSQQIYLIEDLHGKFKHKSESRTSFVAALGSAAAGPNNDFLVSFARIKDFQPLFREAMELVRQESETVAAKFDKLENPNWPEQLLFDKMKQAQKLLETKAISEISLGTEPDLVHMIVKQGTAFGGAITVTTLTTLYLFSPENLAAIKSLLGWGLAQ